jgi:hypothetical protein
LKAIKKYGPVMPDLTGVTGKGGVSQNYEKEWPQALSKARRG